MKVTIAESINKRNDKADVLILPFVESKNGPLAICNIGSFSKIIEPPIKTKDFLGKEGQISFVYFSKEKRIMLLGLGHPDKINPQQMAKFYSIACAALRNCKAESVNIVVPEKLNISKEDIVSSISEAFFLSNYNFDKFKHFEKNETPKYLKSICLIGLKKEDMKIVTKKKVISSAVNLARDLVNNNADEETPAHLAVAAKDLEKVSDKIKVRVFDKKKIEEEKMGLLLAVNKGSDKEPTFIVIEYKGDASSKDHSVIIGKGITYDTGGLSLKPSTSMDTMKCDMSGAAAVLGTIYAISQLNLKKNVTALIPATENSIGSGSYKPGDVYTGMANKSVEVKNTDAEGRLILADAISYAALKIKPNRVINIATLTGACVVALGENIAGFFSNSEEVAKRLEESSKRSGDIIWRMPLFKDYKKQLKSDIADLKNIGDGREAGAITAALFLEDFVNDIPWAHIDIAGPAFLSKPNGLHPTHATGIGVRLLVDFFENLSN
ncbi:MAG: leucyl aminopeptidase [Parachlamydiales bacterium]|jgi:leucyl aminopeptidase